VVLGLNPVSPAVTGLGPAAETRTGLQGNLVAPSKAFGMSLGDGRDFGIGLTRFGQGARVGRYLSEVPGGQRSGEGNHIGAGPTGHAYPTGADVGERLECGLDIGGRTIEGDRTGRLRGFARGIDKAQV